MQNSLLRREEKAELEPRSGKGQYRIISEDMRRIRQTFCRDMGKIRKSSQPRYDVDNAEYAFPMLGEQFRIISLDMGRIMHNKPP